MRLSFRNNTGGTTKIGSLCRIDPKNKNAVINVTDLSTLPALGTFATSVPNGNAVLVDVLGSVASPSVFIGSTPPPSPAIGTIWIETTQY
jgi:hypothetical protein